MLLGVKVGVAEGVNVAVNVEVGVKVEVGVRVSVAVGVNDNAAMACSAIDVRAMEVKVELTCLVGDGV